MDKRKPKQIERTDLTLDELATSSHKRDFYKIISDLKFAFNQDFSNEEACHYAGLSESQFYEWKKNSEGFRQEIKRAKTHLKRQAKKNLAKAITEGEIKESTWFLERRDKDRYSPRSENLNTDVTIDDLLGELDDPE